MSRVVGIGGREAGQECRRGYASLRCRMESIGMAYAVLAMGEYGQRQKDLQDEITNVINEKNQRRT